MRIPSCLASVSLTFACAAFGLLAVPRIASAEWPQNGRAICTAPKGQQHPKAATDGADGAIITWQDLRSPRVNVFARRVLATGEADRAWPVDGVALLTDSLAAATGDGGQIAPVIVSDGAGGAIVVWQDLRSDATAIDLFTQHVLASGEVDPNLKPNGTAVCIIEGIQNDQAIVSDGAGGAIVTWLDGRPGANATDIYAQHILANGGPDSTWPENGLAVCSAPGSQEAPAIAADGAGGAIITWHDLRAGSDNFDIYAQHVLNSGTVDRTWPVDGLAVCLAGGSQGFPEIASDGAGGAVIAWTDGRIALEDHIFAQHVRGSGTVDPAWPANGLAISHAGDIESRPLVVTDGAGGAIVTWQGFITALNRLSLYAQHVTAAGVVDPAWPSAGKALSSSEEEQTHAEIVSDGAGGAIVAWDENFLVFAQHVLASGALDPTYPDAGLRVSSLPGGNPTLAATSDGGAVVAWTDARSGTDVDIYAMQVLAVDTVTSVPSPPARSDITFARPSPNPARGPFTLRFALPRETRVRIAIFDASGRRVRELSSGSLPPGEHVFTWDLRNQGGQAVGAGLYFARLEAEGHSITKKLVTLR